MLQRLMHLLAHDRLCTAGDLAQALGVPAGLVAQMMEQLTRQGYLEEVGGSGCEDAACSDCASGEGCLIVSGTSRTWMVTDKGRRAALAE
jgi:DNA-binding transcriptional MocR family regulator